MRHLRVQHTLIGLFLAVACLAQSGLAQTTQPSPAAWDRAVASLVTIAMTRQIEALRPLLAADCSVRRFGSDRDADPQAFLDFLGLQDVIGNHAYVFPPVMMAADIAQDIERSPQTPDDLKQATKLGSAESEQGAGAVGVRWVAQALQATDGSAVGVLVLWDASPDDNPQHRAMFVLVKGKPVGDDFQFTRIVYGDPLQ